MESVSDFDSTAKRNHQISNNCNHSEISAMYIGRGIFGTRFPYPKTQCGKWARLVTRESRIQVFFKREDISTLFFGNMSVAQSASVVYLTCVAIGVKKIS